MTKTSTLRDDLEARILEVFNEHILPLMDKAQSYGLRIIWDGIWPTPTFHYKCHGLRVDKSDLPTTLRDVLDLDDNDIDITYDKDKNFFTFCFRFPDDRQYVTYCSDDVAAGIMLRFKPTWNIQTNEAFDDWYIPLVAESGNLNPLLVHIRKKLSPRLAQLVVDIIEKKWKRRSRRPRDNNVFIRNMLIANSVNKGNKQAALDFKVSKRTVQNAVQQYRDDPFGRGGRGGSSRGDVTDCSSGV